MSTKTWQEEFIEEFSNKDGYLETGITKTSDVIKYIEKLRKKDEEELIKIIPELTDYNPVDGGYKNLHKLIKDYYENTRHH